jgi:hemerythrin
MATMPTLRWTIEHAVYVTEIDDQHHDLFDALAAVQQAHASADSGELQRALDRLSVRMTDHFAHEERLMRAARYSGLRWHRQRHKGARKRVAAFADRIQQGDAAAAAELVKYLTAWLDDHTRVADRMMGAALRNHNRALWKIAITAGTRPLDACDWLTTTGEPLQPPTPENAL